MDRERRERLELRSNVFKALGHPTRLYLVQELAAAGRNVSDLTKKVGDDISTVSQHLSVLKKAGIVRADKQGANVTYSLRVPCVIEFLDCVERMLTHDEHRR